MSDYEFLNLPVEMVNDAIEVIQWALDGDEAEPEWTRRRLRDKAELTLTELKSYQGGTNHEVDNQKAIRLIDKATATLEDLKERLSDG